MTNLVYQTAVEELEAVLSPRVVSRSLKEGLRQLGRSPDTADLATLEQILKDQVYRQLQVTMPVTDAKAAISGIVDRLREVGGGGASGGSQAAERGLAGQAARLERLRAALRPFNLYFEWPEVQKLRAQIQLLETEHDSGRESYALGMDAESQLELVVQKLEDQLVLQAREVAELYESLEEVRSLGGPKVRRLETLVHQVNEAQSNRQLAPAEIDRARRLARELRKLVESSVYTDAAGEAGADPRADATPETPARPPSPFAIAPSLAAAGQASEPLEPPSAGAPPAGAVGAAHEPTLGEPAQDALSQLAANSDQALLEDETAQTVETGGAKPAGTGAPASRGAYAVAGAGANEDGLLDVDSEDEEILSIDTSQLDPEVHQRLKLLDLAAELEDLAALEKEHAELLNYRPGLAERLAELRAEVEQDRSVAEVLAGMRGDLSAATTALRDDLREELEEIAASLEGIRPEVEYSELSQAVRVTLGILSTALPSLSDVDHVRQLRRLVGEQVEALQRADELLATQLRTQQELLARLEGTLVRYEAGPTAAEEVQRLRQELESLREAQERRALVPEVMASARMAEEKIAQALAERATEASERRRGRLEALRAQVEGLPVTDTLSDRAAAVRREIDRLLAEQVSAEAASALLLDEASEAFGPELALTDNDPDLEAVHGVVESLRRELGGSIRRRIEELAEAAVELGSARLAERLHLALAELDNDRYPDLAQLAAALQQEREAHRLEQVGELHRLSRAAAPFAGVPGEAASRLTALLTEAKQRLDRGASAPQLIEAAALAATLEAESAGRLSDVPRRLDEALEVFHQVAKLNSEDVATVRRILMHLDSQREALGRVSLGLRLQLEASLTQAESLLEKLKEEYEATRLIADQLVSEGLLDGVFGLGVSASSQPAAAQPPRFDELLQRYLAEDGVSGAALVSPTGELLAGELPLPAEAVGALRTASGGLAQAADGERIVTVESGGGAVLLGWTEAGTLLALGLESPALLTLLANRVRRDLNELSSQAR